MVKNSNLITVGIPTYNARNTIKETLESINIQTYLPHEVIIIDDCSTETYEDILRMFPNLNFKYIKLDKNKGVGNARNEILKNCSTKYLTMIDSDDIFASPIILQQVENHILNNNYPNMVTTKFMTQLENGVLKDNGINLSWCHGKFYNVNVIRKLNLKFLDTRTHEEAGLNNALNFIDVQKVSNMDSFSYIWKHNPNSITRGNDDYLYNNFKDYMDGVNYLISKVKHEPCYLNCYYMVTMSAFVYYDLMRQEFDDSDKLNEYKKLVISTIKLDKNFKKLFNLESNTNRKQIIDMYYEVENTLRSMYPNQINKATIFDFVKYEIS